MRLSKLKLNGKELSNDELYYFIEKNIDYFYGFNEFLNSNVYSKKYFVQKDEKIERRKINSVTYENLMESFSKFRMLEENKNLVFIGYFFNGEPKLKKMQKNTDLWENNNGFDGIFYDKKHKKIIFLEVKTSKGKSNIEVKIYSNMDSLKKQVIENRANNKREMQIRWNFKLCRSREELEEVRPLMEKIIRSYEEAYYNENDELDFINNLTINYFVDIAPKDEIEILDIDFKIDKKVKHFSEISSGHAEVRFEFTTIGDENEI